MTSNKKPYKVFFPESLNTIRYTGKIYGAFFEETGIFNVFTRDMRNSTGGAKALGEILASGEEPPKPKNRLIGYWENDTLYFTYNGDRVEVTGYDLTQNVFSRNTGILETDVMKNKCAFLLGCGSVGSLIALELARAGVGHFVLIDNDIVEYHNLCRHQCAVFDVGNYKVNAVAARIKAINPAAAVEAVPRIVEDVGHGVFDRFCLPDQAIVVGCADNREADIYANSISVLYGTPFVSIGFWERAFAGEIFYHLPGANMPCYRCALGENFDLSQRQSTNRRMYTHEEDVRKVNFEPGISVDINFVTTIGVKLILDILNRDNARYTPRLLPHLQQYTLVCNTNDPKIGGEMAEIFSYPLQVTTSLKVGFRDGCPPCEFDMGAVEA